MSAAVHGLLVARSGDKVQDRRWTKSLRSADAEPPGRARALSHVKPRQEGATVEPTVELDYRRGAEIEVSLLWHRDTGRLSVTVRDNSTGEMLRIPVAADKALHAFHHPYAYAALTVDVVD